MPDHATPEDAMTDTAMPDRPVPEGARTGSTPAGELTTLPVRASDELPGDAAHRRRRLARYDVWAEQLRALRRVQRLALVLALALAGAVGALAWQGTQSRVVPYVVEVDRHGDAVAFGPASEVADPDRRMVMHALTLWVIRARTVSADATLQSREILDAYAYTGGRAVGRLNGWFRDHPPFERARTETVSVRVDDVESVLALDETETRWRLQWTETVRGTGGGVRRRELWQALVTVTVDPPEAVEEVLTNPLGIRVTDFDWQRIGTD